MELPRILHALLIAASLIACSAPRRELPAAGATACSVYEAFYEQVEEKDGVFFRSATIPLPPIAGGQFDRSSEWASEFRHLDGRRNWVIQSLRDESIDASSYFGELESPPNSIESCFGNGKPAIHDGTLSQARLREALRSFGRHSDATLVTISPVAISSDGRHALIYATYECGGLCGGGVFYAFERGKTWTRIRTLEVWVS